MKLIIFSEHPERNDNQENQETEMEEVDDQALLAENFDSQLAL